MSKNILVYECIFAKEDEDGNFDLYQAPEKDFSHLSEYVEESDLVFIGKEYDSINAVEALKKIHSEWAENWDMVVDFFGQELADKIDKVISNENRNKS